METKIDDILADYSISAPERTIKRVACEVINNQFNTNLTIDDVRYQQGTIWVDTAPIIRSQIHMNKKDITEAISNRLEDRDVSDIN